MGILIITAAVSALLVWGIKKASDKGYNGLGSTCGVLLFIVIVFGVAFALFSHGTPYERIIDEELALMPTGYYKTESLYGCEVYSYVQKITQNGEVSYIPKKTNRSDNCGICLVEGVMSPKVEIRECGYIPNFWSFSISEVHRYYVFMIPAENFEKVE